MIFINRNVTIVVVILVLVVIAGYLVWLRGQYSQQVTPESQVEVSPSPTASPSTQVSSPSAEASPSSTPKAATSGATKK